MIDRFLDYLESSFNNEVKDDDYYRREFIESATNRELRQFTDPDCKWCEGDGFFEEEEGDPNVELHKILMECECIGALDEEGLIEYQKNKMKGNENE
jgi:hypothetical protein